jgi:hypothetical protein
VVRSQAYDTNMSHKILYPSVLIFCLIAPQAVLSAGQGNKPLEHRPFEKSILENLGKDKLSVEDALSANPKRRGESVPLSEVPPRDWARDRLTTRDLERMSREQIWQWLESFSKTDGLQLQERSRIQDYAETRDFLRWRATLEEYLPASTLRSIISRYTMMPEPVNVPPSKNPRMPRDAVAIIRSQVVAFAKELINKTEELRTRRPGAGVEESRRPAGDLESLTIK